jgi:hypothetical protein
MLMKGAILVNDWDISQVVSAVELLLLPNSVFSSAGMRSRDQAEWTKNQTQSNPFEEAIFRETSEDFYI